MDNELYYDYIGNYVYIDLDEFLSEKSKWLRTKLKLFLIPKIILCRKIEIIFVKSGLDSFPMSDSFLFMKQASSEVFNQLKQKLEKHFGFAYFFFKSEELQTDSEEFKQHLNALNNKSIEYYNNLPHHKIKSKQDCTIGFRCRIIKINFL